MYRKFDFEGDVHETLWCVPLCVRRKLDLAGLKISLEGWQALPMLERQLLCELPVDGAAELAAYRHVLRAFASDAEVALKPLADPDVDGLAWRSEALPERLRDQLELLDVALGDGTWRGLDEETRYALLKLSHPKRNPAKLPALLRELGFVREAPALDQEPCAPPASAP